MRTEASLTAQTIAMDHYNACRDQPDLTRVLLVDPDRLVREGLKNLLMRSGFKVSYEAEELQEAAMRIREGLEVDLVLTDVTSDDEQIIQTLSEILACAKVVILAHAANVQLAVRLMSMRINGFLLRNISSEAFLLSLRLAILGERVSPVDLDLLKNVDAGFCSVDVGPSSIVNRPSPLVNFSSRELAILDCLTCGLSNKTIALKLELTEAIVKAHLKAIMRKINAKNRTQAAIWGVTNLAMIAVA
jgi:two-component system nitrate/nitrite response regulator NarL